MKRYRQRPICPHCGSADVSAGSKHAQCNRCGHFDQRDRFNPGTSDAQAVDYKRPPLLAEDRRIYRPEADDSEVALDQLLRRSA